MGFCDLPGTGLVCDFVVGGVSDSITESIGKWIAKSCGDLAKSAVDLASRAVDKTTNVDLGAGWFRDNYALILPIALVMLVMTFMFQLVRSAWRRDGQALGQAVTATISSTLFAVTAITFTGVALTVVDALSRGLFTIANSSMDDAVRRIVRVSMISVVSPLGWAVPALVALGCAVGAILYWGMMIFRKVSILVLVILAPFAAAGGPWEPTRDWRRRWVEATATVVFSKLVMTIIMLVGVSAIGNSDTKDGIQALSDIIAGLVVMALVLLCPFMIYKFVHWAGDGQSAGLHQSAAAGLQTASATAKKGGRMAMTAASGGAAGGAAMAGGSPAGPSQVPGMQSVGASQGGGGGGGPEGPNTDSLAKATPASFQYGQQRSGGGDGGVPLVKRPNTDRSDGDQGRALVTRPTGSGTGSDSGTGSGGSSVPAASAGSSPAAAAHAAAGSPGLSTPGSAPAPAGAPVSPGSAPAPTRAPSAPSPVASPAPAGSTGAQAFGPVITPPPGPARGTGTPQRFTFPSGPPSD
ncbi:conjugal transfer protein TrbL family protein [Kitasatospora sp. NPDC058048]|uniref:SCO6881 family protein n=1 Tax=Kitasatospora sp. NPDC058048 TaxID=3346313 RepID=UPI0036DF4D2E